MGMVMFEADSSLGKPIEVGGLNIGAMKPNIFPSHIISHDVENMGAQRLLSASDQGEPSTDPYQKGHDKGDEKAQFFHVTRYSRSY